MHLSSNSVPGPSGQDQGDPSLRNSMVNLLLAILTLATVYTYVRGVPESRFPWDDGSMAQMAERVLMGQLPHVDFSDTYSGLLNYWHAAGFLLGPVDFLTLRVQLAIAFSIALMALFITLVRFFSWRWSLFTTMSAALLGPVVYAGPMPSWYNLILALCMIYLLARPDVAHSPGSVFWAGFLGGVSMDIKITGLYCVAAGLVFIAHSTSSRDSVRARLIDRVFFLGMHAVLLSCVVAVVWWYGSPLASLTLGLPYLLLAVALSWQAFRQDLRFPFKTVGTYALAVLLAVMLPILVYWTQGELPRLFEGLFLRPALRVGSDATSGLSHGWASLALGVACGAVLALRAGGCLSTRSAGLIIAIAWAVCIALAGSRQLAYLQLWGWLRLAPLTVCACTAIYIIRGNPGSSVPGSNPGCLLLACFLAFIPLIQVPFPHGIYILYFAPLAMAGWMMIHATGQPGMALIGAVSLLGLLLSSLLWFQREELRLLGLIHQPEELVWSGVDHATLKVPARMSATYIELTRLLRHLGADDKVLYAGPDAPEVPFLARTAYWHPALYDMFEPLYLDGNNAFEEALDQSLIAARVEVVVINMNPAFSRRLSEGFLSKIATRYGNYRRINTNFLVIWTEQKPAH